MTEVARVVMRFSSIVIILITTSATIRIMNAQDLPVDECRTQLTIQRIFDSEEFTPRRLEGWVWSEVTDSYFVLAEVAGESKARALLRASIETGEGEVIVEANEFTIPGQTEPLVAESVAVSADESKLLIYANSQQVWRKKTRGDYFVFDLTARSLRQLGGNAKPATLMFAKFSPDGSRVAYVRENNLYVQDLETWQITPATVDGSTKLINGTSDWVNEEELQIRDGYRWSPDGESIAFWQFDTTGVEEYHLLDNTSERYPKVISFPYPQVGHTNSATRLGVVSAGGGEVCWLDIPDDPREHYLPRMEWTPDGKQLLVQQMNRLQNENRVLLADPTNGATRRLFVEKDAAWLENENPVRWVDDGASFVWLSERSGWRHAYLANLDGRPLEPITSGDFDVIGIEAIDEVNRWLYFAASPENPTQRYLYRVPLDGGTPERLTSSVQAGWHTYTFSPNARFAVHTFSNFQTPPVIELIDAAEHRVLRLLESNEKLHEGVAALEMPTSEFLRIPIGSGELLDAWCLTPTNFDAGKKYPILFYVYGEPHGQTARDEWQKRTGLWHRMLAQNGYFVASVDSRGVNVPRGRAWRKCVHRKIGILSPQDQAAAARAILDRFPAIDRERVGIWGWSGGGSSTLHAIFRYPRLYRTAIAVAPNAKQILYDTIYQERYMGLPDDNAAGYWLGSPITYARQLQGNLLVVHGTGDDNTHFQGTDLLADELVRHNKQFMLMAYPGRSHAISEGVNTRPHMYTLMTEYLNQHLRIGAE